MSQHPKLTSKQREILAIIAGHPEAVHFHVVQELELLGYIGGEGTRLEITEQGKFVLCANLGCTSPDRADSEGEATSEDSRY